MEHAMLKSLMLLIQQPIQNVGNGNLVQSYTWNFLRTVALPAAATVNAVKCLHQVARMSSDLW